MNSYAGDKVAALTAQIRILNEKLDKFNDGDLSLEDLVSAVDFNSLLTLYHLGLINEPDLFDSRAYENFVARNDSARIL